MPHSLFAIPPPSPPLLPPAETSLLGFGTFPFAAHGTARIEAQVLVAALNLVVRGHIILAGDVWRPGMRSSNKLPR